MDRDYVNSNTSKRQTIKAIAPMPRDYYYVMETMFHVINRFVESYYRTLLHKGSIVKARNAGQPCDHSCTLISHYRTVTALGDSYTNALSDWTPSEKLTQTAKYLAHKAPKMYRA